MRCGFDPCVRKILWIRAWQSTPVFLPGESHGQKSIRGAIVHRVAKSQRRLNRLSMHLPLSWSVFKAFLTCCYLLWFFFFNLFFNRRKTALQVCVVFCCAGLHAQSRQSCQILCYPTDCSSPGSSVRGILQSRMLEWVAMPSSRGSFQPRNWNSVSYASYIGRQHLYH